MLNIVQVLLWIAILGLVFYAGTLVGNYRCNRWWNEKGLPMYSKPSGTLMVKGGSDWHELDWSVPQGTEQVLSGALDGSYLVTTKGIYFYSK